MRGAVSLAAALAIPLDIPGRPVIIFLTFALILVTLVGQGLSLPFIVRALKLEEPRRWSDEEAVARMEAAQAALDRIDEMEGEERAADSQLKRLRDVYRGRFRMCQAVLGGGDPDAAPGAAGRRLRRAAQGADRGRARGTAQSARQRPPPRPDAAPDRARPRPRGGADPSLSCSFCSSTA